MSDGLPPLTELLQIDENLVSGEDTEHSKSVCLALCNVHARASDIMGASESAVNEGNCGIAVSSSDGDCSATWRKDQILDLTGFWCLYVSLAMLLNFWYTFGLDFRISRLNPSNSAVRVPECLHSAESHRHICASASLTAFRVSATASPAPHPQYRLDRSTKQCTRLRLDTGAIFFSFSETVKCVNIMPCITRR